MKNTRPECAKRKAACSLPKRAAKPTAVVVRVDSLTGIQTTRTLAEHGVPVIGLAGIPRAPYGRTRLCEKIICTDPEGPELISTLLELGPQLAEKAVLFPCNDPVVSSVSRHRKELLPWYHIILPSEQVVDLMLSKDKFYAYSEAVGLPIARTVVVSNRSDLERAARELTFPCIVKPVRRTKVWHQFSNHKGLKVTDVTALRDNYEACHEIVGGLIVQEWIVGDSSDLYSCNLYLDANCEPLATFVSHKIRQWPADIGSSSAGQECRNDVVLETALDLFKETQCHGLSYLEMKRDARTGQHIIIEPNIGRPTGRSPISEAGGVELIYTMYCDALGWPLPTNRVQTYGDVKWLYLRQDLQSAFTHWLRGELSFVNWYNSLRGKKVYALLSLKDPGPFLWDLWATIAKIGPRLWKRMTGVSNLSGRK